MIEHRMTPSKVRSVIPTLSLMVSFLGPESIYAPTFRAPLIPDLIDRPPHKVTNGTAHGVVLHLQRARVERRRLQQQNGSRMSRITLKNKAQTQLMTHRANGRLCPHLKVHPRGKVRMQMHHLN